MSVAKALRLPSSSVLAAYELCMAKLARDYGHIANEVAQEACVFLACLAIPGYSLDEVSQLCRNKPFWKGSN
jgi:hypothetical protein